MSTSKKRRVTITLDDLRQYGACDYAMDEFARLFSDRPTLSKDEAVDLMLKQYRGGGWFEAMDVAAFAADFALYRCDRWGDLPGVDTYRNANVGSVDEARGAFDMLMAAFSGDDQ